MDEITLSRLNLKMSLKGFSLSRNAIFVVLAAVIFIAIVSVPQFRTPYMWSNVLLKCVALGLVCIGQTFVIVLGGIDLAVGGIVSLSTCIASEVLPDNIFIGITYVLGAGIGIGLINGIGVVILRLEPFILTLATFAITQGLSLWVRPYPGGKIPMDYTAVLLYRTAGGWPVVAIGILALFSVAAIVVLRRRAYGREIYAVGGNEDKALRLGINVGKIKIITYALSGLTASLGGLVVAAEISTGDPIVGEPYIFESITAVLLGGSVLGGGVGGYGGTLSGVIILSILGSLLNMLRISTQWQKVIAGFLLIVVVLVNRLRIKK